jgi:1-acyl-sn-glycerol-3-phosphate acyltransferase
MLRPFLYSVASHEWAGAEHLPPEGVGCVVVCNHVSHLDPLTFAQFLYDNGRAPRMLAKSELMETPLVGPLLHGCGQIPVYRESADASAALRAAYAAVEAGECVGIFPEATLTRDPELWPMRGKFGAARIALHTGCPVIPVGQWGIADVLAPYSKVLKALPRSTVQVKAGPPVDLDDLQGRPARPAVLADATDRIMTAITSIVAELRGEEPPAERFDPATAGVPITGNPRKQRQRR